MVKKLKIRRQITRYVTEDIRLSVDGEEWVHVDVSRPLHERFPQRCSYLPRELYAQGTELAPFDDYVSLLTLKKSIFWKISPANVYRFACIAFYVASPIPSNAYFPAGGTRRAMSSFRLVAYLQKSYRRSLVARVGRRHETG